MPIYKRCQTLFSLILEAINFFQFKWTFACNKVFWTNMTAIIFWTIYNFGKQSHAYFFWRMRTTHAILVMRKSPFLCSYFFIKQIKLLNCCFLLYHHYHPTTRNVHCVYKAFTFCLPFFDYKRWWNQASIMIHNKIGHDISITEGTKDEIKGKNPLTLETTGLFALELLQNYSSLFCILHRTTWWFS